MKSNLNLQLPLPIIDEQEMKALDKLTEQYKRLIEPSFIASIGETVEKVIPEKAKKWGYDLGTSITEKQLYSDMMDVITSGFKVIEKQAAKFSIDDKQIISSVNQTSADFKVTSINEICLMRSYNISKAVNSYKNIDTLVAFVEGGGTGAFDFWGLPFNLVLSTFLFFRAVQSVAMFYGYDVKNDSLELVIASEVFSNALSPRMNSANNKTTNTIGKIMLMSQATLVKQTAKKTWTDMASRGGVPLIIAQIRALAHKSAQNALNKAGAKGLENSIFRDVFEQIGRKMTLKTVGKTIPFVSALIGALIDTAQMRKVLDFADIFYQKRFITEKTSRVHMLINAINPPCTDKSSHSERFNYNDMEVEPQIDKE